ncbi:MAG: hypothetical protein ACI8SE_000452, partial [Bacteroidia bacterium]
AFSNSYGVIANYKLNHNSNVDFQFGQTQLVNSYNIYRYDPGFSRSEKKSNKNIPSLYWNTKVFSLGYSRKILPSLPIRAEIGVSLYSGQLSLENFPEEVMLYRDYEHSIVTHGEKTTINYEYFQHAVAEYGWAMKFGLKYDIILSERFVLQPCIFFNTGLNAMANTLVKYSFDERPGNLVVGEYESITTNSGIQCSVRLFYRFKRKASKE